MEIIINDKTLSLPEGASVAFALSVANIMAQRGVAVAVNSSVISSAEWELHILKENDKIMVIKATQGG